MTGSTDAEVMALGAMDLEGLRAFWRERFGAPPRLRSPELLRQLIAWRLQAAAHGGLNRDTRRALTRTGPVAAEGLALGDGTRISRNWQGRSIEVVVAGGGFEWNGRRFASLSAVARAVTGARWNGPRFFGLREEAQP